MKTAARFTTGGCFNRYTIMNKKVKVPARASQRIQLKY